MLMDENVGEKGLVSCLQASGLPLFSAEEPEPASQGKMEETGLVWLKESSQLEKCHAA